ncbi:MAG: ABC transporter substrate-binding protein [Candidatus Paceibacterota bacterium]
MNNPVSPKEFHLKSGKSILSYVQQFSSTERVVFGALVVIAGVSALLMAGNVNSLFTVEVPGYGGEIREGVIGLPRTINPILAITDVDRDMSALIYSGLMKYSGNDLVPDLAKSYKISDDGLTYTFVLRENLRFHDGESLTAEDIAFTVQKIQDPALKSPRRADWLNIVATVVSPTEIKFTLKQPYSPFLTNTTVGIIPKHIWNNVSNEQFIFSQFNIEPIGSGLFIKDVMTRDAGGIPTTYRLSAWKDYYGKSAHVNNITFYFFADADKALLALDNGEIDSIASVSSSQAKKLATDSAQAYEVLSAPLPRIFGVFFNQNQSPVLADKVVRQALNMSVDRSAIVNAILNDYGIVIDGPLPSLNGLIKTAVSTTTSTTTSNFNITAARALLEKNGWVKNSITGIYEKKNTKNVVQTLAFDIYTADTADLKQAAEMIRSSWNSLGAQVNIKVFESSDLYQNIIRTRKYDALLFGELVGKDHDVYAFWHSSQRNSPGLNVAMYTNSKVDKLLEDIRSINDTDSRTAKYIELNKLINTDIPAIFIYSPNFIYVTPKTLRGINIYNITTPSDRFNSVENWYVNTEKVWKIFSNN